MSGGARRDKADPPGVLVGSGDGAAAATQSTYACWCLGSYDGREKRLERKENFKKTYILVLHGDMELKKLTTSNFC